MKQYDYDIKEFEKYISAISSKSFCEGADCVIHEILTKTNQLSMPLDRGDNEDDFIITYGLLKKICDSVKKTLDI